MPSGGLDSRSERSPVADAEARAMIFRQLLEPLSSTYTYLLGCEASGEALLIDPVVNAMDRDLQAVADLGLRLTWTLETHIHADHITAARYLKERVGSRIAVPAMERLPCADAGVLDGVPFAVGGISLRPIHTPGHTDGHFAFALADRVFTGDALLIDGCGRTDFQNGDASALYESVTGSLFALADECLVYPAHDYQGRRVSSIGQEKARNPRLGGGKSREDFERIMAGLNLPYPKFIDYAVPGNRQCGVCPDDVPEQMQVYCGRMTESPQG
jgi:glyoxylase-like metal-dependent hydrolase (beta-lactamase superfamily II)